MEMTEHPSNVLSRGQARDFSHAMELLQRAVMHEVRRPLRSAPRGADYDAPEREKVLLRMGRLAFACWVDYQHLLRRYSGFASGGPFVDARNNLALQWIATGDYDLARFGQALLAGDYSALAF